MLLVAGLVPHQPTPLQDKEAPTFTLVAIQNFQNKFLKNVLVVWAYHFVLMWPVLSTPIVLRFDAYWPMAPSIKYSSCVPLPAISDELNDACHLAGWLGLVNPVMMTITSTANTM